MPSTAVWFAEVLVRCLKGVYVHVAIFSNQLLLILSRNQSHFIGKNYGGFSLINGFLISKTCSNLEAFLLFGPPVLQDTHKPVFEPVWEVFDWNTCWCTVFLPKPTCCFLLAWKSWPTSSTSDNPNTVKIISISNLHAGSIKFGRSVVYGLQVLAFHIISRSVFNGIHTLTQAINSGPIGMDLGIV